MSCTYTYHNPNTGQDEYFQSEASVYDWLLSRQDLLKSNLDIVYQTPDPQAQTKLNGALKVIQNIQIETERVKHLPKTRVIGEDGESFVDVKAPYIGVNRYVATYEENGNPIIPVFDSDNYWYGVVGSNGVRSGGRYSFWEGKVGHFTDTEKEVLESIYPNRKFTAITDSNGDTVWEGEPLIRPEDKDLLQAKVKKRWEQQCLSGDAVHSVFELYFSQDEVTGKLFKDVIDSDPEANARFISTLKAEKYKGSISEPGKRYVPNYSFEELLNEEALKNVLAQAKQFAQALTQRFGDGALYFPELEIVGDLAKSAPNGADKLYGIIDLLVIDSEGRAHIFDYKTSTKDYGHYHSSKKLTFRYQLAAYQMLLEQWGFNFSLSDRNGLKEYALAIVPMRLSGFKSVGDGKYSFDGIEMADQLWYEQADEIISINNDIIHERLATAIKTPEVQHVAGSTIIDGTDSFMKAKVPQYTAFLKYSDDEIRQELEKTGALTPQVEGEHKGKLVYKPLGSRSRNAIVVDPAAETRDPKLVMFEKVKARKESARRWRKGLTEQVVNALKAGIEFENVNAAVEKFPKAKLNDDPESSPEWFKLLMKRFCNKEWQVMEGNEWAVLQQAYGMIALYNKDAHAYEFIKITSNDPTRKINSKDGRNTIARLYHEDLYYESRSDSLMLEQRMGNYELMEAMAVINQIPNVFGNKNFINGVSVINPVDGKGVSTVTNKELIWNFNELMKHDDCSMKVNNFANGNIKFADQYQRVLIRFNEIMNIGMKSDWLGDYVEFNKEEVNAQQFDSCKSQLHSLIDNSAEMKVAELKKLSNMLLKTDSYNKLGDIKPGTDVSSYQDPHTLLFYTIQLAIAELSNIDYRQQLDDHAMWLETSKLASKGLSSNMLDNPGNMLSQLLNKMTSITTLAFLNTRERMGTVHNELRKQVEAYKKAKGYNVAKEMTFGNETSLYQHLIDEKASDFRFKSIKDPSLDEADKAFLKYTLDVINKRRFPKMDQEQLDEMREAGNPQYYRIPLMKGDSASRAALKGLWNCVADTFKSLDPREGARRLRDKLEGLTSEEESEERKLKRANFFEMTNVFDAGESEDSRMYQLKKHDPKGVNDFSYFETNIETIIACHEMAYISKQEIDNVMPLMRAGMVCLRQQGILQNTEFKNDIDWMHKYITNKVKKESIQSEIELQFGAAAKTVQFAASVLALGFSPVMFTYQHLSGFWNDICLIYRKDDGSEAFTFKNFVKAAKEVYKDMFRKSTTPSVVSRLNQLMGVNDQDIVTYARHNTQNQHGIWNFENFLFRFVQRPDYYNRMTIIVSKMIEDGSFEAHSLNDGELKYDWTKDKRFSKYAANPTSSDPEVAKQRALYIATVQEMIREGVQVVENGKSIPLELRVNKPMALPRAYTTKEIESMKSITDTIYGYYSTEKKAMVASTLIGSLFFQMKHYWSGKKNQYLGNSGVKLQGHWEEIKDDSGELLYYLVDEKGIHYDQMVKASEAKNKDVPVVQWRGDWREGVALTLSRYYRELKAAGYNPKAAMHNMWTLADPIRQLAYRQNIRRLGTDLLMFILGGQIICGLISGYLDDLTKESDVHDPTDLAGLVMMRLLYATLRNSFADFNMLDSIGSPMMDWQPFSFSYISKDITNLWDMVTGERNVFKGLAGMSAATKPWTPVITAWTEE